MKVITTELHLNRKYIPNKPYTGKSHNNLSHTASNSQIQETQEKWLQPDFFFVQLHRPSTAAALDRAIHFSQLHTQNHRKQNSGSTEAASFSLITPYFRFGVVDSYPSDFRTTSTFPAQYASCCLYFGYNYDITYMYSKSDLKTN